ncbi:MAG: hypothetical protein EPN21_10185 [Methylococcaceae bacterium]|nr:MAG: hypothetical protein EPN21_10185 [Methylococcaceae bacterium]
MKFLLDANMPRAALHVLLEAGHQAAHVRDVGLGDAVDEHIDGYADKQGLILVTRDLDFCDTRSYPPEKSPGRLVLRVADSSTAQQIAQLLERFMLLTHLVDQIPGHLVVINSNRVRFRPALLSDAAIRHKDE